MVDWRGLLLDPKYSVLGVSAVLTPETSAEAATLTVIDKTKELSVTIGEGAGVTAQTMRPSAKVRAYELAANSIGVDDLSGAGITFNGQEWTVQSYLPLPTPAGEASGEIRLFLTRATP